MPILCTTETSGHRLLPMQWPLDDRGSLTGNGVPRPDTQSCGRPSLSGVIAFYH